MKASGYESTTNVHFRKVKIRAMSVLVNHNFECSFFHGVISEFAHFCATAFSFFYIQRETRFTCTKVDAHKI